MVLQKLSNNHRDYSQAMCAILKMNVSALVLYYLCIFFLDCKMHSGRDSFDESWPN